MIGPKKECASVHGRKCVMSLLEFLEQEQISRRIHAAASAMTAATVGITEWDDGVVYQMLEKVTVLTGNRIKVTFRNGVEIEQTVDQPKRRKFA